LPIDPGCFGRHSLVMKFTEAWRLSSLPYREVVYRSLAQERNRMWWGSFGRKGTNKDSADDSELSKKALRIAKFDKGIISLFNIVVSIIPFVSLLQGSKSLGLSSSVSLSLAITFGFMTLYAIQTLSSFVGAESSVLLSTLPISTDDFSLITLFSFVRSVDYLVVGSVLSQVVLVEYLTLSPLATALMFVASLINSVFAVALALWLSRVFHKNYLRGGRSKRATVFRGFFVLLWGCLLMGVGLLLSVPYYVLPILDSALQNADALMGFLLSLLYPFSAGLLVSRLSGSIIPLFTVIGALAATVFYALGAWFSAKWSLGTVKLIAQGAGMRFDRSRAIDFQIKAMGPLIGYVRKDLRVTSRNPATAFFFVLPIFETVIVAFLASNLTFLRASTVLAATSMGAIFALLIPLALLNSEGKGIEYSKTLPITSQRMVFAKALITVATFLPVPVVLLCLALFKSPTSWFIVLIPFFMLISIFSASIFEILIFLRSVGKSRIAGVINDVEKILVGLLMVFLPAIAYAIVYLLSFNHAFAALTMCGTSLVELWVALFMLRRK
jgi:predicted permease